MRTLRNRRECIPHSAWLLLSVILLCWPGALPAQSDPRGDWRTWRTPHFRVHAWARHASIALTAAAEAERAYAALSRELRPPRGITDLVLYDNVDFPNGFTNVFPTRVVTIYLTPPAGEIGLGRYDEWLRLVITHELTHVFHLDRADGVWGSLQRVFGRAPVLFPNLYQPAWVGEGLATYYESRMTAAGRERGSFHSQLVVAAGRWPAPGDVNFSNSGWPAGLGPYAWGSRFFSWEDSAHGDSLVPRFVDHTSRRLWPFAISASLKAAGGDGLAADWRKFGASWASSAASPERSVILARGSRVEPHPRLSADGQLLAFVESNGKDQERVVVRDIRSGSTVASHRLNGSAELAWDGKDLIIGQMDYANPVEIRSKLYRWSLGGGVRRLSPVPRLTRPFDLGGSVGAIQLGPGSTTVVRIVGDSTEALPVPEGDAWSHVVRSPDGSLLAGARHLRQKWDIVVWPSGSPSNVEMITDDDALDEDPAWSVDGKTLLFTSERAGLPQIYGYDLTTRSLSRLTNEPSGAREGDFGPDGTVYFSTVLADGYAVGSRPAGVIPTGDTVATPVPTIAQPTAITADPKRYSPWASAAPRYWLPLWHDVGEVGHFLGAFTSGSDAVGRLAYAVGLAHATDGPRWEGLMSVDFTRWAAVTLDLSARQYWDVGGRTNLSPAAPDVLVAERHGSLTAGATIRQRRWRSDVSFRVGAEITQDAFFVPDSFNIRYTNPAFAGAVASTSLRYTHRQALSISDEDGVQFDGLYRQRWATGGPGWSNEARGTLRAFLGLPLPGFSRWVLAGKITGVATGGPYAKNYALGGQSGTLYSVLPGTGLGSTSRDFGLRGYPADVARFTRVVTTVAELRVPVFLAGKGVWRLPLSVNKVSLTVFGETGGGWRQGIGPRDIAQFRDAGAELVFDLGINLDSPLRVRVGAAESLVAGLGAASGAWRGYATVGTSF